MNNEIKPITTHDVESRIIMVRGQKVILDCDVAELYGVETKRINEAVRNNPEKFPPRCIIQLDKNDLRLISSKSSEYFVDENFDRKSVSNKSRYLPKAFTERGLYMLATILKSPRLRRRARAAARKLQHNGELRLAGACGCHQCEGHSILRYSKENEAKSFAIPPNKVVKSAKVCTTLKESRWIHYFDCKQCQDSPRQN